MDRAPEPTSFVDPEVQRCPFPHYDRLRAAAPVYRDSSTGFDMLMRYGDVRKATADTTHFSSKAGQISVRDGSPVAEKVRQIYAAEGWLPVHSLVNNDPPDHGRFRAFVDKAFLPRHVRAIEPYIRATAEELCRSMPDGVAFDLIPGFSLRLPLMVISHELGVPASDLDRWNAWAMILLEQMNPDLAPERELELTHQVCEMQQYLARRIAEVRAAPGTNLLTHLVLAADEGQMTMAELLSVIQMLVPAGHETTANAISAGVRRLAETPDLQAKLRANPSRIPAYCEEVLRLDAPIQGLFRRAVSDTEIDGCPIWAGNTVVLSWGAANRDPDKFPDPSRLDLERRNANQHLSFGAGAHFCVGNQLARAEMRIAFETMLATFRSIQIAPDIGVASAPHFFAFGHSTLGVIVER